MEPSSDADPPEGDEGDGDTPVSRSSGPALGDLSAFSHLQRQLAGLNLTALAAIQRAVGPWPAFAEISGINAAHTAAATLARSIDKAAAQAAIGQAVASPALEAAATVQRRWAEALANAIDIPSLVVANTALLRAIQLDRFTGAASRRLLEGLDFTALTRPLDQLFKSEAFKALVEGLAQAFPDNLRETARLEDVAHITLEEGLPLAWVPRSDIVAELVEANDADEREQILTRRFDDIVDDCRCALEDIPCEWAAQSLAAVASLAAGFEGPAQSHASNIIDSIVLQLLGRNGRELAKQTAQDDFVTLELRFVSEALTLRPLYKAFTPWFPDSGTPPPTHFARHATSHAVGHGGLFSKHQALIAVMLATSLTCQFWDDPAAPAQGNT